MPEFFAATATGLAEALEKELQELGFPRTERIASGVFFDTNWEGCFRANIQSRLASRITKPIMDFVAYQNDELYAQIRRHDFTKYILPTQTLKVDCSVADSMMRDQRFVALKVKDAVVDQFRDKFGVRPDVSTENPDLRIIVKVIKNEFHVAIDTTGDSLFMRGYRREAGPAPLKENLAAGLVRLTEWDRKTPIVDPTCGSGTILIEAAMLAMNVAPGTSRKSFGFQKLLGFQTEEQQEAWKKVLNEAIEQEKPDLDFKLYGYDIDREALRAAKRNAFSAGVDHVVEFAYQNITTLKAPVEKGLFISNPPYGARLGEEYELRDMYRDMGHTLKTSFKGWDAWILSGNKDLIGDLKLKSTRRHFIFNGPLECRFLKYSMF